VISQMYKDTSSITRCIYVESGTNICSDVIAIELAGQDLVRYFKISTTDYLMLCEVEVFAGKNSLKYVAKHYCR